MVLVAPGLLVHAAQGRIQAALARLAHFSGAPRTGPDGLAHLVCALLGLPSDPPVAALLAAGAGLAAGNDYWLVADPVTLVPGRSDVLLAGRVDDLARADGQELLTALNAHFLGDGLAFHAARPNVWLVRCTPSPALATTTVERARGAELAQWLPRGDDAPRWRRWQDEIQMLFHAHPVNLEREASGAGAANAIWFWGGGRLQDAGTPAGVRVDAPPSRHGDLARGIAVAARTASSGTVARTVIVTPAIGTVQDAEAVVDEVLSPALMALERGEHDRLDVLLDGNGVALAWSASAPSFARRLTARWAPRTLALPRPPEPCPRPSSGAPCRPRSWRCSQPAATRCWRASTPPAASSARTSSTQR